MLWVDHPPVIIAEETTTNLLISTNSQITALDNLNITGNVLNQTASILSGSNLTIYGDVTNNVTHYTTRTLYQD